MAKLREHPSVQKLITRYDQLPRRDQQGLQVIAVALLLGLLYFMVWRPAADFHDASVADHDRARDLVAWMQQNRAEIRQLAANQAAGQGGGQIADSRALMSTVTSSAREAGLQLQRFEPSGDNAIRVWMEDVPFNQLAAWLERLTANHGIVIDQAALDRSDQPGRVSARFTLEI
ncbi:MAG: type II secretion system protein M [Marinobacter sp.]|uniref:type II secretion system protein M n=1 Tax=Marinobacter sp. TaxID=50741 RepID=UPI00299DEA39|nr:type II secretion system protein M [Marinobacter sp.]MDX1634560.1 type II secretion system protein M [Marinobacter sp.]